MAWEYSCFVVTDYCEAITIPLGLRHRLSRASVSFTRRRHEIVALVLAYIPLPPAQLKLNQCQTNEIPARLDTPNGGRNRGRAWFRMAALHLHGYQAI